ncbi:hypothetical protein Lsed01_00856 [Demequina sediminis]|uniref:Uncharacterized protein n=2 Tax=Demequina sediminis TaxID=1930058 RepID=A0ABP9WFR3_9MICO|nr:hypothetical protein [Demequina sediminis]BDZ62490.1 hypothetical protein GCM10025873_22810 [Demequina sediminis]
MGMDTELELEALAGLSIADTEPLTREEVAARIDAAHARAWEAEERLSDARRLVEIAEGWEEVRRSDLDAVEDEIDALEELLANTPQ